MNDKLKALLLLVLSLACLIGIRASCLEITAEDYFVWGLSTTPPREWIIFLGALCLFILPWSLGWTIVLMLRGLIARHYDLSQA
jgi:hypothetical protein